MPLPDVTCGRCSDSFPDSAFQQRPMAPRIGTTYRQAEADVATLTVPGVRTVVVALAVGTVATSITCAWDSACPPYTRAFRSIPRSCKAGAPCPSDPNDSGRIPSRCAILTARHVPYGTNSAIRGQPYPTMAHGVQGAGEHCHSTQSYLCIRRPMPLEVRSDTLPTPPMAVEVEHVDGIAGVRVGVCPAAGFGIRGGEQAGDRVVEAVPHQGQPS